MIVLEKTITFMNNIYLLPHRTHYVIELNNHLIKKETYTLFSTVTIEDVGNNVSDACSIHKLTE